MVKPCFHIITHISNYIFISSILENFFSEVRYHPLIENFPEYTSLSRERVPFNQTEKFSFGQTLTSGRSYGCLIFPLSLFAAAYDSCLNLKPCTEVTYSIEAEAFTALTSEETRKISKCHWTDRPSLLILMFSRTIIMEYVGFFRQTNCLTDWFMFQEDYVVKSVDLISGIGGTLGLWLGLSLFSIGTFIIQSIKSISSLKMFK